MQFLAQGVSLYSEVEGTVIEFVALAARSK